MTDAQLAVDIKIGLLINECERVTAVARRLVQTCNCSLQRVGDAELDALVKDNHPRVDVLRVVEAVQIFAQQGRPSVDVSWDCARRDMSHKRQYLDILRQLDRDTISPETMAAVEPYASDEDLRPAKVQKYSPAGAALCEWFLSGVYYCLPSNVCPQLIDSFLSVYKYVQASKAVKACEDQLETAMEEYDRLARGDAPAYADIVSN